MAGGRLDALGWGRAHRKEFGLDFGVMGQLQLLPGASLLCCEWGTGLCLKGPSGRRCLHLLFPVGKQQRASDHFPGLFSQFLGEGKCSLEHLAVAPRRTELGIEQRQQAPEPEAQHCSTVLGANALTWSFRGCSWPCSHHGDGPRESIWLFPADLCPKGHQCRTHGSA